MTAAEFAAAYDVSRETLDRLRTYAALLEKWNPAINLVSKSTLPALWSRHMADSAQLFALCPLDATVWVDLGSGGGFPGLVVGILAAEKLPSLQMVLVESDARKATFLSTSARAAGISVRVERARAEILPPLAADVVSARALGPLSLLIGLAERHLKPHGMAVFPKGVNAAQEIADALALWRFQVQKTGSRTEPDATVLSIRGIARV